MNTLPVYFAMVMAAWAALTLVLGGAGLAVRRWLTRQPPDAAELLFLPWLGWAALVVWLQLWHLVWRVNAGALVPMAALGVWGLAANRREIVALLRGRWRSALGFLALLFLAAAWLANHTINQPKSYDSGFYHIAGISWACQYPIVPGLGNLFSRLAFNNSSFLCAALLDHGPFVLRSHHLATGLLILWLMARGLLAVRRLAWAPAPGRAEWLHALILVVVVIWTVNGDGASSPSPDAVVYLLGLALGARLFERLAAGTVAVRGEEVRFELAAVALLAAVGMTVKLSFLALGLSAVALSWVWAWRHGATWRALGVPAVAGAAALLPWMVRGMILSGYPVFPLNFAPWSVEWRMPVGLLRAEADWIRAWARLPHVPPAQVLGSWRWVWPWFTTLTRMYLWDVMTPLALAVAAGWLLWRAPGAQRRAATGLGLFCLMPLSGLLFCLATAPNPRFAGAAFWLLGLGVLAAWLGTQPVPAARSVVLLLAAVLFARDVNVVEFLRPWRRDPGPVPQPLCKVMTTESGLDVFVPQQGDQLWAAPLPATPYFNRGLRLRRAGDLSRGFTFQPPR